MTLKSYQKTAVDKLLKISNKLLKKDGQRVCVLKAPTGSGKTIMIADFLKQLAAEQLPNSYAFIWVSGNNLHKQSRDKLERYLNPSRYTFSYLEEIQNSEIKENEIVFVNWHSLTKQDRTTGEYTNVFMRDNETDQNLRTFVKNTKENGLQIILIVDESHYHYWSLKSQQLVQEVIGPKLTLEVSATPKLEPSRDEIDHDEAGYVSVRFDDVIAEGMIKSEVIINKEIGKYSEFSNAADEAILSAALEERQELAKLYEERKSDINPLMLIQLPSESESTSSLDKTKLEFVESFLKEKHNITVENGLLGIWLSERKDHVDNISDPDSSVQVLIFKQAIALGWDCPRAQVLVMFREIKSVTFEIQTVGRILRTPEAKHYEEDQLNKAYVYTNLEKLHIAQDKESQSFFQVYPAHRTAKYSKIELPSTYLSRIDYGDLTLSFRKLFLEEANKYFGVSENDMPSGAKKKADVKLDLLPSELKQPVISDTVIQDIDDPESILGPIVNFPVPEDDLKYKFEYFAKARSVPYAPVRSHTKIQQAIYDWFDDYLGYKDSSRIEIQRIVVCSENNQKIFKEIIETAKDRFKEVNKKEKQAKQPEKAVVWDVPALQYFNELYEAIETSNYSQEPCYVQKGRSAPEKEFEDEIKKSKTIDWWYKNGTNKESFFALPYQHPIKDTKQSFYPDFIIHFKDGSTGIYDTKSEATAESTETAAKSDALYAYLKELNSKGFKVKGGIVNVKPSGMFIYEAKKYSTDPNSPGWHRAEI
ncbi:MAG: DEAD/DEAH box helicase family protein [bacterium]|nr:DEAD/DEAH box helicase family protein [bacterium]